MRTAHFTIDADRVSPSKALATVARASDRTLIVVSHRALAELAAECGGYDRAPRRLLTIATNSGKPIAVNLPRGEDDSTTIFIPPRGWSEERLRGWVAGHHAELEAAYGPVAGVRRLEDL